MSVTKRAFFTRFLFTMCMAMPCVIVPITSVLGATGARGLGCILIERASASAYVESQWGGSVCASSLTPRYFMPGATLCETNGDNDYTFLYYDIQNTNYTSSCPIGMEKEEIRSCVTCSNGYKLIRLSAVTKNTIAEYFGCADINDALVHWGFSICYPCEKELVSEGAWAPAAPGYLSRTVTYKYSDPECGTAQSKTEFKCDTDNGYEGTANEDGTAGCVKTCVPVTVCGEEWTRVDESREHRTCVRTLTNCSERPMTEYRCISGYYPLTPREPWGGCTRCPSILGFQSTSETGAQSITDCCVEQGWNGDDPTGYFEITDKCCATEES